VSEVSFENEKLAHRSGEGMAAAEVQRDPNAF
jgi:hypothetical protein